MFHLFQKTEYKGLDYPTNITYTSVVRSCSQEACTPRADTENCTVKLLANPGCMVRHCCNDKDLCNSVPSVHAGFQSVWILPLSWLLTQHILPQRRCITPLIILYSYAYIFLCCFATPT